MAETTSSGTAGVPRAALLDSGGVLMRPIGGRWNPRLDLGCRKPDPRMYRHASEALGTSPGECVFVDDDAELVAAAIELGYAGRVLCREGESSGTVGGSAGSVPSIRTLTEVLDLF
ncbi:HAD-IA family hydrolase [Streptomyces xylophagus]|uniref:HAD-IA family hydrolase n=1 Tax=Streptomyces xylophagus TaxID=285514 RepID=UPI0005BDEE81|nr:HAD-IA family hydrolase [Streptomyces xylophagus]